MIGSTQLNSRGNIAVFVNSSGEQPRLSGTALTPTSTIRPPSAISSTASGPQAAAGLGSRRFRVSACRLCVFENNTFENANDVGGVFKMHNGNTYNSVAAWTGVYTELIEISDNLFTGNSGAILSDISPQNGGYDERLRNFVIERNLYSASTTAGAASCSWCPAPT